MAARKGISYFAEERGRNNNPNFFVNMRDEDLRRQVKRIVRDMVRGSIKYEEVGMYFLDMKFLENLIIGIKNELDINIMNYNACCFQYQYYPMIPNLGNHITALSNAITVYQTVLNKLNIKPPFRESEGKITTFLSYCQTFP